LKSLEPLCQPKMLFNIKKNAQIQLGGRIQISSIISVIVIKWKKFLIKGESWISDLIKSPIVYLITNHFMVTLNLSVCVYTTHSLSLSLYIYMYMNIYVYNEMIISVYRHTQWTSIKDEMDIWMWKCSENCKALFKKSYSFLKYF
jgi:hypothetical protein